jgi:hypothetical protein
MTVTIVLDMSPPVYQNMAGETHFVVDVFGAIFLVPNSCDKKLDM